MRRFACLITAMLLFLSGCAAHGSEPAENGKPSVVASLFPQYDFVRQIARDKVDVTLLLPPGSESHSFDPRPSDMTAIYNSDLFIYTGGDMEPWAARLISGAKDAIKVVDASHGVELLAIGHAENDGHDRDDGHDHGEYDPHIWLDPTLAMRMVDNITEGLCEIDSRNAEFFRQNAEAYKLELQELDDDTFELVRNAERDTLVFGGRFAYIYFLERYGINYVSAFDSCSTESEPSLRVVTEVCGYILDNDIPCIYYEELSDPKLARSISEKTGASPELFSTGHNVTLEEFDSGVTFIDVMRSNLSSIGKGLN